MQIQYPSNVPIPQWHHVVVQWWHNRQRQYYHHRYSAAAAAAAAADAVAVVHNDCLDWVCAVAVESYHAAEVVDEHYMERQVFVLVAGAIVDIRERVAKLE